MKTQLARPLVSLLRQCTLLALAAPAFAGGRIVVAFDDWTLSNQGFSLAPSTPTFALNVANWFTGGAPGNFLVRSANFGLTQTALKQTMTGAGHTWTVSTAGTFDLALALQYDAIFVGGTAVSTSVLTDYVNAGGNVYIFGGSGSLSEATTWNPFLNVFGLSYSSGYVGTGGVSPISSSHPVLAGVTGLYHNSGSAVNDLDPVSPHQLVIASEGSPSHGLYGIYDGDLPTVYCAAKVNSLGCVPSIAFTGTPSASATSGFVVRATSVLNNKSGLCFYSLGGAASSAFQGGVLCVASPIKRTTPLHSGGNAPPNDCSGVYQIDMNAFAHGLLGGAPLPGLKVAGNEVCCQFWGRDPGFAAPNNTTLSNALRYRVLP
jgi:hypothetical protein